MIMIIQLYFDPKHFQKNVVYILTSSIFFAASAGDNGIRIWDVLGGKLVQSISTLKIGIRKATFISGGDMFLQVYGASFVGCSLTGDLRYTKEYQSDVDVITLGKHKHTLVVSVKEELIFFNALTGSEIKRKEMPAEYRPFGREFLIGEL